MKNYAIKIAGQTYEVEILDLDSQPAVVRVNGEIIEVWREAVEQSASSQTLASKSEQVETQTKTETLSSQAAEKTQHIKSPIPGVITSISVKPGTEVQQGAEICRLEAMKMSNVIRSPRSGKIGAVLVSVGEHVRHQQPLIEFAAE